MHTLLQSALFLLLPLSALSLLAGVSLELLGSALAVSTALLFVLALWLANRRATVLALVLFAIALSLRGGEAVLLRYYPVVVCAAIAISFTASCFAQRCLIERIALKMESDLPLEAQRYCRKVHYVWTCYLWANTAVLLYLASFASLEAWALYTGVISYVLTAVVFIVEYAVRICFRNALLRQANQ